jgi:hypothetical protein
MSRYVMYVYLDNVRDCAWIVDFNVRGGRTDCGPLFDDWIELWRWATARARSEGGVGGGRLMPEMRVVTKDMKSMMYNPLSS